MQQQSSANMRNMEQTMIVLQNDIKSLTYKLANYKETALKVSGGTLSLYGPAYTPQRFRIRVDNGSGPGDFFVTPLLGELRYFSTNDNTVITLENGAVIEKPLSTNGSFMLADPRWYLDNTSGRRVLVINFMNLSGTGSNQLLSQTGIGTVRMRLENTSMMTAVPDWGGAVVYVSYSPDNNKTITPDGYGLAWKTYLTNPNNLGMTCSGDPLLAQALDCWISNIQNIVIKEYDIVVETL
jgi:hypothetical protein